MNVFRSFAFKNSIIYLIVFFFAFGVFGFLMFKNSSVRIIETANKELQHRADLLEIQTIEYYNELVTLLNYLTFNPVLDNYLGNQSRQNYELLSNNYLSLLEANPDFSQIRYIDAETGMEVVRVEKNATATAIIKEANLQNKKDRPYFINSLNLKEDQIYISPIDLNKEYGKISHPRTPTLRLARLVYHNGRIRGVVVININLTTLFADLKNTVGNEFSMQLLNEDGYYLVHEDIDSTFLFEYPDRVVAKNLTEATQSNQASDKRANQLRHSRKIEDDQLTYALIFNVIADKDTLLSSYHAWRRKSIWIMLLTIGFLTGISFYLINRQSKNFGKITAALRDFPKNRNPPHDLMSRTDEIGVMAKEFVGMAGVINAQIDEINAQKLKAEEAFKDKSEFIENISHEIRNPLQSIMGLSAMLEKNNPNPNQVDILNSLKFTTANLHGLVNNVLDFQHVLKGDIVVENNWSDLVEIINEVINGHKYAAYEKRLTLKADMDAEISLYQYKVDRIRLSQIISNLISNAIKFSTEGGVIKVACHLNKQKQGHQLSFSVIDNGIGISEAEIVKIKERYFTNRGVKALSSSYGIGLTIVTELLEIYNSKLEITSQKGEGSVFSFRLNLDHREALDSTSPDSELLSLEGLKLLILEDDKQITNFYLHLLSKSHAQIIYKEDIDDIQHLEDKFDLIISDYRFDGKSLMDVMPVLHQLKNQNTPLIIASGSKVDTSAFSDRFNSVSLIRKPFSNIDFIQLINQSIVIYKYGQPTNEQIKADYDYEPKKYANALSILLDEWESISNQLLAAIESNDRLAFEETHHKFVTTLRRLELHKFSDWLEEIQASIPNEKNNIQPLRAEVKKALDTILLMLKVQN